MPMVEISNGELIDKLTILDVKMNKLTDEDKLVSVGKEYAYLSSLATKLFLNIGKLLYSSLFKINSELWDVEDELRIKIKENDFGVEFIMLAKSIPELNACRFNIKSKINKITGSKFSEVKEYA